MSSDFPYLRIAPICALVNILLYFRQDFTSMKKLLIIIFLFISVSVKSTNYYVKTAGNNSNTGLSDAQAWATISEVNKRSFKAGDNIFFNKGDTWRETLVISTSGTKGHYIVFTSYGTGNKPIITGADIITSWTQEGSNYYTTFSTSPKFVFNNGVPLRAVALKASLVTGKFWRDVANSRIYVSFNPTGHIMELTIRDDAIRNAQHYITIDGLQLVGTNFHGINADKADNGIYRNCTINYITSRGIFIRANPSFSVIENNSFNHIQGYDLYMFGGYDIIRNNIIKNTGDYYTTATPDAPYTSGIAIHPNDLNGEIITEIYNNVIDTLYGDGSGLYSHGIYIQYGTSGLNIYGNTISNIREGDGIKMAGGGDIHDNILYNNYIAAIGVHNYNTAVTVNVYNNVIYNNGYGVQQYDNTGTLNLSIYNNTFYKNSVVAPLLNNSEIYIHDNINSLTLKNNIFYASDGNLCYYIKATATSFSSDYNIFYREDARSFIAEPTQTFVAWKALGNDAHSLNADPLLVSTTDFHLREGSPAIGAGINVGLNVDHDGDVWFNPPSIGTYEYNSKPPSYEKQAVKIYPNPAHEYINISIDDPALKPDFISIINLSGKVVFNDKLNQDIKELKIPINLIHGFYIVQTGSGNKTLFTNRLVVN
jgi:Secretion system C-terminal sorting domain/Right handed beta helix region